MPYNRYTTGYGIGGVVNITWNLDPHMLSSVYLSLTGAEVFGFTGNFKHNIYDDDTSQIWNVFSQDITGTSFLYTMSGSEFYPPLFTKNQISLQGFATGTIWIKERSIKEE